MQKEFIRYGKVGTQLVEERAIYLKAGTEGLDEEDTRTHELEGEDGKWLAFMIGGYLGDPNTYDPSTPHMNQVLREGVTILSKEDFDKEISAGKAEQEKRTNEIAAKRKAETEKLITAFRAGKLYEGDKELFMAVHGFDPDVESQRE